MLVLKRCHHRHHRLDTPRPSGTLGPEAACAPQDPWADCPLGRLGGRLHPVDTPKGPQGLGHVAHLATDPLGFHHTTGLAGVEQVAPPGAASDACGPGTGRGGACRRGPDARRDTSAGPALAGRLPSPGNGPHAPASRHSRAADAPSSRAAIASDTRGTPSSDPSPRCRSNARPSAPRRPSLHAPGGPQRRGPTR